MRNVVLLLALSAMFGASQVFAATVTFSTSDSAVTAVQQGAATVAAPAGTIYEFFTTTSADILSVNQVVITVSDGSVFNAPSGDDDGESSFAVFPGFEGLQADSWLSTPTGGAISILGGGFNPLPDGDDLWGDATDDGAQAGFQFARITLTDGATGTFSGRVSIDDGTGGVFNQPFSFPLGVVIPEPASLALGFMGLIGMIATHHRRVR